MCGLSKNLQEFTCGSLKELLQQYVGDGDSSSPADGHMTVPHELLTVNSPSDNALLEVAIAASLFLWRNAL